METTHSEFVNEIERYVLSNKFSEQFLTEEVSLVHSKEYCLSRHAKKRRADFIARDNSASLLILGEAKTVADKKFENSKGEIEERFLGQLQMYLKKLVEVKNKHLIYALPLTKADWVFYTIKNEAQKLQINDLNVHIITINYVYKAEKI